MLKTEHKINYLNMQYICVKIINMFKVLKSNSLITFIFCTDLTIHNIY